MRCETLDETVDYSYKFNDLSPVFISPCTPNDLQETGDFEDENPGFWIKILDELALRAGFSWRHSYGIVRPLFVDNNSFNPNATTTDLLVWTVNTYDFSFGEWDGTVDRMKLGVDFPTGFSDTSTILIANKNKAGESSSFYPFAFLRPFDILVWGAIVATIILTGIAYRTIHKLYSVTESQDENTSNRGEDKTQTTPIEIL